MQFQVDLSIDKQMGVEYFEASGTVEASSQRTRVFQSIEGINLKGFFGLMLAVIEDTGFADGTRKQDFDIRAWLTYSAVCGIGLDTVPIPGDTTITKLPPSCATPAPWPTGSTSPYIAPVSRTRAEGWR